MEHQILSNTLIPISSVAAIAVIGFFSIRYSQLQNQRNAISDMFKILEDDAHKVAEDQITTGFKNSNLYEGDDIPEAFIGHARIVLQNYSKMGLLVERKLIPKEAYYSMYGKITVISYFALSKHIERRRTMENQEYHKRFTSLALHCWEYWSKKGSKPTNPLTNGTIERHDLESPEM